MRNFNGNGANLMYILLVVLIVLVILALTGAL